SRVATSGQGHRTVLADGHCWSGDIYRSVSMEFATQRDLLTGIGAKNYGGRWNPKSSFAALYGSLDLQIALIEWQAFNRRQGIRRDARVLPRAFVGIEVRLQRVLDLTNAMVRRRLCVSRRRMRNEPWREAQMEGREALTQAIGCLAREA